MAPESKIISVLNGPNLNLLGQREPAIYGTDSLDDIAAACAERAHVHGFDVDFRQSNAEAKLIDWIQEARESACALVINGGALTHTSIGIFDALTMLAQPIIEVHLSNIYRRESFRHHSYVSRAAKGVICGFGAFGYILAVDAAINAVAAQGGRNNGKD